MNPNQTINELVVDGMTINNLNPLDASQAEEAEDNKEGESDSFVSVFIFVLAHVLTIHVCINMNLSNRSVPPSHVSRETLQTQGITNAANPNVRLPLPPPPTRRCRGVRNEKSNYS